MPGIADFLSSIFGGGQEQQVQPIQPLAANGQEANASNPPSPATDPFGATNAQLGTVQSQNPIMQQLMQQQKQGAMGSTLKVLLPLIAGFAQESQLSRQNGPYSRIGAALGGAGSTFLQMQQTEAQQNLQRAQLLNSMSHEQVTEQQGAEGLAQTKQKTDYETKAAGTDITSSLRQINPDISRGLPSSEAMAKLPAAAQMELYKSSITLADTRAKLAETMQNRVATKEDRELRINEMHEANQNMYQARKDALDAKIQNDNNHFEEIQEQIKSREKLGQNIDDLKRQSNNIAQEVADDKKQANQNENQHKYDADYTKRLIDYNKHWTHGGMTMDEAETAAGFDPVTHLPIRKGATSTATPTTDTGGLGAP